MVGIRLWQRALCACHGVGQEWVLLHIKAHTYVALHTRLSTAGSLVHPLICSLAQLLAPASSQHPPGGDLLPVEQLHSETVQCVTKALLGLDVASEPAEKGSQGRWIDMQLM